jgi:hypothetical protein
MQGLRHSLIVTFGKAPTQVLGQIGAELCGSLLGRGILLDRFRYLGYTTL